MKTNYLSSGRTKQKTETRNRLLKQAQTLLSAGNSFSLDDIANESGISRATVYRYYSSIDVLVAEAGLDIKTLQPEHLFNRVSKLDTTNRIIKIQNYFNELALKNEEAFRKIFRYGS